MSMDLTTGQRAQRKLLITVAEWGASGSTTKEVLGVRTPDSSIEFNPDTQKTTDVLGIGYTDVEKTEPQQTFDPHYIIGGSALDEYMVKAALANDIDAFNGAFTIYVITAFIDSGSSSSHAYYAVKHEGCTILPTSLGGEAYTGMPLEVHLSNDITEGTVDKLDNSFTFTAAPANG